MSKKPVVIIGGYGPGLGQGLASSFQEGNYQVVALSRQGTEHPGALNIACDLTDRPRVNEIVDQVLRQFGRIDVYIHNVFALHINSFRETTPEQFTELWRTAVLSAVHTTQRIIPSMIDAGSGTILVSGATAAIRGGENFSAFASAKFALRGLTQSLAREFHPLGIHVANVILDGLMFGTSSIDRFGGSKNRSLQPADVAKQYLNLVEQPKSCWTHELDLRPHEERF